MRMNILQIIFVLEKIHRTTWKMLLSHVHIAIYMSYGTTKRVFGSFWPDETQTDLLSYRDQRIWNFGYITRDVIGGVILSWQRTTKALIRLRACAGWSAPLLFAHGIRHIFLWPGSYIYIHIKYKAIKVTKILYIYIILVKHGFPCINICQVPRKMLKIKWQSFNYFSVIVIYW